MTENKSGAFPHAGTEPKKELTEAQRREHEEQERLRKEREAAASGSNQTGGFPRAKPEDRYVGAPGTVPPVPAGSPPAATVPAAADPNALPSNVRQFEEVRERELAEMMKAPAFKGADVQFQQPGAPSQQIVKPDDAPEPQLSEATKAEQEAGRKAVAAAEAGRVVPGESTGAVGGETYDQLEAKRKEAEEREKIWGKPGDIAGSPR